MRGYGAVLSSEVMKLMAYPAMAWGTLVVRLITLGSYMLVWNFIYAQQDSIAGYEFKEMLTYYMVMLIITSLSRVWSVVESFSDFVHKGKLSLWLLRPIRTFECLLGLSMVERGFYTLLPIILLVILIVGSPWVVKPVMGGAFVVSICLSVLLAHYMFASVGLIAFWVVQTSGIKQIFARIVEIMGGSMFPLDILPIQFQVVSQWLPFQFIHFVPAAIYLGTIPQGHIWSSIGMQMGWLVVFVVVSKLLWRKGVRHYESVGI